MADLMVIPEEYTWLGDELHIIDSFIEIVEKTAEENMLKTGKLEGSHYAAMKQIRENLEDVKNPP